MIREKKLNICFSSGQIPSSNGLGPLIVKGAISSRQTLNTTSSKANAESFLSQRDLNNKSNNARGVGLNSSRQLRQTTLGRTLSKIDLPERLIQQKELFNEVGGWLSAHRDKAFLLNNTNNTNNRNRIISSSQTQYNVTSTSSSLSFQQTEQGPMQVLLPAIKKQKKQLFYEHKSIFRVKDFKALKSQNGKIVPPNTDDPISAAQRRGLLQAFELKVQQFLKLLNLRSEIQQKHSDKSFRDVIQSLTELEAVNSFHNASNQQSVSQMQSQSFSPSSKLIHNRVQSMSESNLHLQHASMSQTQGTFLQSPPLGFTLTNEGFASNQSQLSMNSNLPLSSHQIIRSESMHSGSKRKRWAARKEALMQKSMSDTKLLGNLITERGGQERDLGQWQNRIYYRINESQFEELTEKQLAVLSAEERDQYTQVLNHFKTQGQRFTVQVQGKSKGREGSGGLLSSTFYDSGELNKQRNSTQMNFNMKTGFSTTDIMDPNNMSAARFALHEKLQDFILERCKKFLTSDRTNYDEKLSLMKRQYEQMLDNFEKKSFKITIPGNMRVRGQAFNDYYIIDENDEEKQKQEAVFEELFQDNFEDLSAQQKSIAEDQEEEEKKDIEDEISIYDDESRLAERKKRKMFKDEEEGEDIVRRKKKQLTKKKTIAVNGSGNENEEIFVEENWMEQEGQNDDSDGDYEENMKNKHGNKQQKKNTKHPQDSSHLHSGNDQEDSDEEGDQEDDDNKRRNKGRNSQNIYSSKAGGVGGVTKNVKKTQEKQQKQEIVEVIVEQEQEQPKVELVEQEKKIVEEIPQIPQETNVIEVKDHETKLKATDTLPSSQQVINPSNDSNANIISDKDTLGDAPDISQDPTTQKGTKRNKRNNDGSDAEPREIIPRATNIPVLRSQHQSTHPSQQGSRNQSPQRSPQQSQRAVNVPSQENNQTVSYGLKQFVTTVLGTGFLDLAMDCEDLFDLNIKQFKLPCKKAQTNSNISHKSEADRVIFEKLTQWELEVEEYNVDFIGSTVLLQHQMIRVQKGIEMKFDKDNGDSESKLGNEGGEDEGEKAKEEKNSGKQVNRMSKTDGQNDKRILIQTVSSSDDDDDEDDSSKSQIKNSFENLDHIVIPDRIPSVSDCSAFEVNEQDVQS